MIGHRGRSALLKRLFSQDDQEESYESTSLKREEGEPFTLLLILASVVGHFIREKNLRCRMWRLGDGVETRKGVR